MSATHVTGSYGQSTGKQDCADIVCMTTSDHPKGANMSTLKTLTEKFQREQLTIILAQCTPEQRKLFNTIFPDIVRTDQLESAYDLVERTLKKNKAGRT